MNNKLWFGDALQELVYNQKLTKGNIKKLSDAMVAVHAEGSRCSDTLLTCLDVLRIRITMDMLILVFEWGLDSAYRRNLLSELIDAKINTVKDVRRYLDCESVGSDFDMFLLKGHLFDQFAVKKVVDRYSNNMTFYNLDKFIILVEKLPTVELKSFVIIQH